MKNKMLKKLLSACLVGIMAVSVLAGCGSEDTATSESKATTASSETENTDTSADVTDDKPDSWIADRTIKIQTFIPPNCYDYQDSLVIQKIKELTGITVEVVYTPGESNLAVLTSRLASGDIPDMINAYLDNSSRPEFPVVKKAAEEGLFYDFSELLLNSETLSEIYSEDYLNRDAYENILWNEDFDGAAYILPVTVEGNLGERTDPSVWDPRKNYRGGMYIQRSIAEDLNIDVQSIRTMEQLYDVLVQIKEAGYTDDNGQPITPLGPEIWGGDTSCYGGMVRPVDFGTSNNFGVTEDGKIYHESETEYVYDAINYMRKLLDEGLLHVEFMSISENRVRELVANHSVGVILSTHNYDANIYQNTDWIPLGPLNDITGFNGSYYTDSAGSRRFIAINAKAENPEEIWQFYEWLCSYEGQLLLRYGIEGVSYEMVDGYPVLTEDAKFACGELDRDWMGNYVGAYFDNGFQGLESMLTNINSEYWFNESAPGKGPSTTEIDEDSIYAYSYQLAKEYPLEKKEGVDGFAVNTYLSAYENEDLVAQLNIILDGYDDMIGKAVFAKDDAEVTKIVENYRAQLQSAGIEEIRAYLEGVYAEDPESIAFTNLLK